MPGFERTISRAYKLPSQETSRIILQASGLGNLDTISLPQLNEWQTKFNNHYYFKDRAKVVPDLTSRGLLIDMVAFAANQDISFSNTVNAADEVMLDATEAWPIGLVAAREASGIIDPDTEAAWMLMGMDQANDRTSEAFEISERYRQAMAHHAFEGVLLAS